MEERRQAIKNTKRDAEDRILFDKAAEIQRMERDEEAELAREKRELGIDIYEDSQVIKDNPEMRAQMLAEEQKELEREKALFHIDEIETIHHTASTNTLPHQISADAMAEAQRVSSPGEHIQLMQFATSYFQLCTLQLISHLHVFLSRLARTLSHF